MRHFLLLLFNHRQPKLSLWTTSNYKGLYGTFYKIFLEVVKSEMFNIFTFNCLHGHLVENPIQTLIIRCHIVKVWFIKRAWAACGLTVKWSILSLKVALRVEIYGAPFHSIFTQLNMQNNHLHFCALFFISFLFIIFLVYFSSPPVKGKH